MEIFWATYGSILGYIVLSIALALVLVYAVFLRKKKPGALSALLMGINRKKLNEVKKIVEDNKSWFENTNHEDFSIKAFDGITLTSQYYPYENSKKTIICIHGYLGRYNIDFAQLAPFYHSLGFNVLLLNNRAHGKSGGKFIGFSVKDQHDLFYWINTLDKKYNSEYDIFLHGISMGAATTMLVAGMDIPKTVKGIISDCGFISPVAQVKYLLKKFFPIALFPVYQLFKAFTKRITGNDLSKTSAIASLKKAKVPMLFIHGKNDFFVPIFMSKKAFKLCASEKYFEIFKNAGHAACQFVDPIRFKHITYTFLNNFTTKR